MYEANEMHLLQESGRRSLLMTLPRKDFLLQENCVGFSSPEKLLSENHIDYSLLY
jgi:hypothetical protein